MIEDGEDPHAPVPRGIPLVLPQAVRAKVGMTQADFAGAIGVPLATLRGWEQGRFIPDPAARTLLYVIHQTPGPVLRTLGTRPGAAKPPEPRIRASAVRGRASGG